jgi:hypothetical protein
MLGAPVRIDEVAHALGVTTDAGVVEQLTPVARRLFGVVNLLTEIRAALDGSIPNADQVLGVATGHVEDAAAYVDQVIRGAEEHRRGEW